MTSTPADVAALLRIAVTESATLEALEACVRRLRDAQIAKCELARMPPAMVLSELLDRRSFGGDL